MRTVAHLDYLLRALQGTEKYPQRERIRRLDNGQAAVDLLTEKFVSRYEGVSISMNDNVAKVSIVGSGMESHAGVATDMFEALFDANINIHMISTSEIKISVLIRKEYADKAVRILHDKFFPED